jgi:hypothetical protein
MKVNTKYLSIGLLILALFSIVVLTYMYWTKRWSLGNVWWFKKNNAQSETSETEMESGLGQSEDEEDSIVKTVKTGKKVTFQEDAYLNEYQAKEESDSDEFTPFENLEEPMPVEPEQTKLDLDSIPMFTRVERMFT